jgi:hypothetical protein
MRVEDLLRSVRWRSGELSMERGRVSIENLHSLRGRESRKQEGKGQGVWGRDGGCVLYERKEGGGRRRGGGREGEMEWERIRSVWGRCRRRCRCGGFVLLGWGRGWGWVF